MRRMSLTGRISARLTIWREIVRQRCRRSKSLARWKHRRRAPGLSARSATINCVSFGRLSMRMKNSWLLTREKIPTRSGKRSSAAKCSSTCWRKKGNRMPGRGAHRMAIFLLVLTPQVAFVFSDDMHDLQARFDRESNSVHKAKLLEKLGDAQLSTTRRASQSNDYQTMGIVMEKYRDNARAAIDALKKEHPNAERHTGGDKQLQIHVHKAIRELDEMLVIAPSEYRPPLELVRSDLASIDDELLQLLFPRRPESKKPDEKKPSGQTAAPSQIPAPPEILP